MRICGLNKTTLLDYPGHVAAVIFTSGCNFRCPFCHNAGLVLEPDKQENISEADLFDFLQKRRGVLEGICITGGEPTLQPDLPIFIRKVKELGYLVKLDTNGYRPEVLQSLLEQKMLDYVAMDVKASVNNYSCAAGVDNIDMDGIEKSIRLLKNSDIPYEFRTTVVRGIHNIEEFDEIGQWLAGCKAYFLQAYREDENIAVLRKCSEARDGVGRRGNETELGAFRKTEMEQMAERARKYIDKVELRGVE